MNSNKNINISATVNSSYTGYLGFKEMKAVVIQDCIIEGNGRLNNTAIEFFGTTARITSTVLNENQIQKSLIIINDRSQVIIENSNFIHNKVINGTIFVDNESSLMLQECEFFNNQASQNGGCVLLQHFSKLYIDNTKFYSNTAENNGGAIMSQFDTRIEISNGTVFDCNKVFRYDSFGGAISNFNNVTLIASDSVFKNHFAVFRGGVISAVDNSNIFLSNTTFQNNTAQDSSGAIQCYNNCVMNVNNSIFKDNVANDGGGIETVNATVKFDNCTFENNTSLVTDTGAFTAVTNSTVKISNCHFHKNTAGRYGPAMQFFTSVYVEIEDSHFTDNVAHYGAGVISAENQVTLRIKGSYFMNNRASRNGGVFIGGITAYLNVSDSYFINNTCITGAGGVIDYFGSVFVENSHFINNRAGYRGGAIGKIVSTAPTDIYAKDSTFVNNTAELDGGAIYCIGCKVTSIRSNYTGNHVKNDGGGVFVATRSNLAIEGGTFQGNYAQYGNGGAVKIVDESKVNINGGRFVDNIAVYGGGALHMYASEKEVVRNKFNDVYFERNHVHFMGAAMYVGPWVKIMASNCSFVNNNADTYGGAVKMGESTESCFEQCYFIKNTAKMQGGALYLKPQAIDKPRTQLKLANCFFIDNQSKKATAIYVFSNTNNPSPELKSLGTIFTDGSFINLNTSDPNFAQQASYWNVIISEPDHKLDITETPYASGSCVCVSTF